MSSFAADDESFLTLSADLTGFDRFELQSTGRAADYQTIVEHGIAPETRQRLFAVWRERVQGRPPEQRAAEVEAAIMTVAELRDAARKIIALWYVGSWYENPTKSSVASAAAYVEGLMWRAIASHPMGAKPQGYGAWAQEPPHPSEVTDAV